MRQPSFEKFFEMCELIRGERAVEVGVELKAGVMQHVSEKQLNVESCFIETMFDEMVR